MNNKINRYIIVIASICIIIPFNIIIRVEDFFTNNLLLYLPMFIGYILFFAQYKHYSPSDKKILDIATCFAIMNMLLAILKDYLSSQRFESFSDELGSAIIFAILFYSSYFINRIFSLILGIKILRNKDK